MTSKVRELECLRGVAALYVVAHHTLQTAIASVHPGLAVPLRFGQEAVIVFFLLSGFVIHYSTRRRGFELSSYLVARLRRIYPVFLIALAISYGCASIAAGQWLRPDWLQLGGNLLMLQDRARVGTITTPFAGNSPLWSLSYEMFFYAAYAGLCLWIPERRRQAFVLATGLLALIAIIFFPHQFLRFAAYMIIWWAGVELCEYIVFNGPFRRFAITLGVLAASTLLWAVVLLVRGAADPADGEGVLGAHPILEMRHFGAGLVFAVLLAVWGKASWIGFHKIFGVFAAFAPVSYAIYVLHWPLMLTLNPSQELLGSKLLWVAASFLLLLAVSWIVERPLQGWINRLQIPDLRPRKRQPA